MLSPGMRDISMSARRSTLRRGSLLDILCSRGVTIWSERFWQCAVGTRRELGRLWVELVRRGCLLMSERLGRNEEVKVSVKIMLESEC